MKTYLHKIGDTMYQYFWDHFIKSWTFYKINEKGYQVGDAEHYANKDSLLANYPDLKFKTV